MSRVAQRLPVGILVGHQTPETTVPAMSRRVRGWEWAFLAAVTVAAAALRLYQLGRVSPDPFYDAAVRSMSLSLHNFFLGAFEPGGSLSIDKPPVDLWLQVVSVKVLGFSSTTLKLPEALAGTAAVPALYAAVRKMWTPGAAAAAAIALAVLPVDVITSRSDTMDGVMMLCLVLALLCVLRALDRGSTRWLLAAGAILGVAFNVKLLESLVAVPGLVLLAWLGLPGPRSRRAVQIALAGLVWVVISLSWLTATLLVPAGERPWAIGSTNGSAWNAAFVFNGTDRLGSKSPEPQFTVYQPGHHYPQATQSQRDRIPIVPPSATRLLSRIGPLSGERLGMEILAGLLLGIPALLSGTGALERLRARRRGDPPPEQAPRGSPEAAQIRIRVAAAVGLTVWFVCGLVLFSEQARLHPRYVEAFTPAVAALLGIGAAWGTEVVRERTGSRLRLGVLAIAMVAVVYYAERLMYGKTPTWWIVVFCALGALALALLERVPGPPSAPRALLPAAVLGLGLAAILAVPFGEDVHAIEDHVTDAGYVGALPASELQALSRWTRAHQGSAHYQVAAESATAIGALIVQDARPVLVLTTYNARVFTSVAKLQRLIAEDKVRYAFLNTFCHHHASPVNPACAKPTKWVRAHGTDVSLRAGLSQRGLLYLLPGARPG
jgi:4-amino-4-deoxy-L-arabinose transferase-like glycosyltransferase